MAKATPLTINTDTISRMADTLCAQTPGLSKNAVLGAFAQAMVGPRGHWGSLKASKTPVVQPGLEAQAPQPAAAPAPASGRKVYLTASSHDWNENWFSASDERTFRSTFFSDFEATPESLKHDDKIKYCESFVIDCDTGTVEVYKASQDFLEGELSDAFILFSDQPFDDLQEFWEALRFGDRDLLLRSEGLDDEELPRLKDCEVLIKARYGKWEYQKPLAHKGEFVASLADLARNDLGTLAREKLGIDKDLSVSTEILLVHPDDLEPDDLEDAALT